MSKMNFMSKIKLQLMQGEIERAVRSSPWTTQDDIKASLERAVRASCAARFDDPHVRIYKMKPNEPCKILIKEDIPTDKEGVNRVECDKPSQLSHNLSFILAFERKTFRETSKV